MRSGVVYGLVGGTALVTLGLGAAFLGKPAPNDHRPAGPVAIWASDGPARDAELTAEVRAAQGRIHAKRAIATALIRGEVTVDRAAERFRALLAEEPLVCAHLRGTRPAATDDDLVVLQLITFVRQVAPPDSDRAAALVRALERQLPSGPPAPSGSDVIPGPPAGAPPAQAPAGSAPPQPVPSYD